MKVPGTGYNPIIGTNRWSTEYLKVRELTEATERDFTNIQEQYDDHVMGLADKHTSEDVTFNSTKPTLPFANVKDAIEGVDDRVDNIIAQSGTSDTEVVDARLSSTYGPFTTLKQRVDNTDNLIDRGGVTLDVTKVGVYGLTNCAIDGVTDDSAALQAIFDYIEAGVMPDIFFTLIIPYTGNKMYLEERCTIRRSNVRLEIKADIDYNDSDYDGSDISYPIGFIGAADPRGYIDNIEVIGNNVTIDANGDTLVEPVAPAFQLHAAMYLVNVKNAVVRNIIFTNGLYNTFLVSKCQNILIEDCEANNSQVFNGFALATLPDWVVFDQDDPETWNNIMLNRCRAFDCDDIGIDQFQAVGVVYNFCIASRCGNNKDGIDSAAGGGYAIEQTTMTLIQLYAEYNSCLAIDCNNYGFTSDSSGGVWNNCRAKNITATGTSPNLRRGQGWVIFRAEYTNILNDCECDNTVYGIYYSDIIEFSGRTYAPGVREALIPRLVLNRCLVKNNPTKELIFSNLFQGGIEINESLGVDAYDPSTAGQERTITLRNGAILTSSYVRIRNLKLTDCAQINLAYINNVYISSVEVEKIKTGYTPTSGIFLEQINRAQLEHINTYLDTAAGSFSVFIQNTVQLAYLGTVKNFGYPTTISNNAVTTV